MTDSNRPEDDATPLAAPTVTLSPVRPRRLGGRLLFALFVIVLSALAAAAMVVSRPIWAPLTAGWIDEPKPAPDPELVDWLQRLGQRQVEMQTRLETLPDPATDFDARIKPLQDRIATLEQQLAAKGTSDSGAETALQALQIRIDALEQNLAGIAQGVREQTGESVAGDADLTQRLNDVRAQIDDIRSRLDRAESADQETGRQWQGLNDQLLAVTDRLTKAEQALADLQQDETDQAAQGGDAVDRALLLAGPVIRNAVDKGAPYEAALNLLRAGLDNAVPSGAASDQAELRSIVDDLQPGAALGITSRPDLNAQFAMVADQVLESEAPDESASGDWWDSIVASVNDLIVVRPVGDITGDDTPARLARAQQKLDAGDLAGAVAELSALTGPAAASAAEWRQKAEARVKAEQALDRLDQVMARRLQALIEQKKAP